MADPVLREAREQADATLGGLLAGKYDNDPNLAPVARKVKGYQSCSIKSQQIVREGAADFRGTLTGPAGRARFDMTLVKQASGRSGRSPAPTRSRCEGLYGKPRSQFSDRSQLFGIGLPVKRMIFVSLGATDMTTAMSPRRTSSK